MKNQKQDTIPETIQTLQAFRAEIVKALDILNEGGEERSIFERVQVGRCRDRLRETFTITNDAISILGRDA